MTIADGHKLYAICIRDRVYYLVGPFESYDELRIWGDYELHNGDDPRWQSIQLPDDTSLIPEVHGPDWHPGYTP